MELELRKLKEEGILNEVAFFSVMEIVYGTKSQLQDMIIEWEKNMLPEDNRLYSLGLRRAVDLLSGRSPHEEENEENQTNE